MMPLYIHRDSRLRSQREFLSPAHVFHASQLPPGRDAPRWSSATGGGFDAGEKTHQLEMKTCIGVPKFWIPTLSHVDVDIIWNIFAGATFERDRLFLMGK